MAARLLLVLLLVVGSTSQETTCTISGCNCTDEVDIKMDECTEISMCGNSYFTTLYTESMIGVFGDDSKCSFGDGIIYNASCGYAPDDYPSVEVLNCSHENPLTHVPNTQVPDITMSPSITDSPKDVVTCRVSSCDCTESYLLTSDTCGVFSYCQKMYNIMLLGDATLSSFSNDRCSAGQEVWNPSCSQNFSLLPSVVISNCTSGHGTGVPHSMSPGTLAPQHHGSLNLVGIVVGSAAGALAIIGALYLWSKRRLPMMREPASRHLFDESVDPNGVEIVN